MFPQRAQKEHDAAQKKKQEKEDEKLARKLGSQDDQLDLEPIDVDIAKQEQEWEQPWEPVDVDVDVWP